MKDLSGHLYWLALVFIIATSIGCPNSTSYPLGVSGLEAIDEKILGTWKNDSTRVEVRKVIVTRANKYEYKIRIVEKGPRYETEATRYRGWLTTIKSHKFLVLQEVMHLKARPKFYAYHITIGDSTITTHDFHLKPEGGDAVFSTETYRKEVEASIGNEGFLSHEIVWTKE